MTKIETAIKISREIGSWSQIQSILEVIDTDSMPEDELEKFIDRVYRIQMKLQNELEELQK